MGRMRGRRAGGALASGVAGLTAMLLGLVALTSPLARQVLSGSVQACVPDSPLSAPILIHLRVLALDSSCAEGTYAPGVNFADAGWLTLAVSGWALLLGAIAVLWSLGLGLVLRRVARAVGARVRRLVAVVAPAPVRVPGRRPAPMGPRIRMRASWAATLPSRRGPPVGILA